MSQDSTVSQGLPKSKIGRPAVSSRTTIEEAAGELALEHGWNNISVTEIAARAGVSRSSFFNYFAAKSDLLWGSIDEALDTAATVVEAVERIEVAGPPSTLTHAEAMGAWPTVLESATARAHRVALLVQPATQDVPATIRAEMFGIGVALAIAAWASAGVNRGGLAELLDEVLGAQWRSAPRG